MYDDVLNWFRSPMMMVLIVFIAGGLGYLQATGNMHYLKTGYQTAKFMYTNLVNSSGGSSDQKESGEKKENK